MTALHQYSRLEAAGLWRSATGAQRREVIVGLREATIVLIDPKTELPLTQWSLPAIVRTGAEQGFVTYASHEDEMETLEIDDEAMIAALDKVRSALDRRRKRPGRLRSVFALLASSAIALGIAVWIPLKLYDFTAQRLPDAARSDIAAMAMADIATISGSPCSGRMGVAASADLARRLAPNAPPDAPFHIAVLREGLTQPASLPDGTILLPYALVERADGPDALAGMAIAQRLLMTREDALVGALRYAGVIATLQLLSSGALPSTSLQGYGLDLTQRTAAPPDIAALHSAFAQLQISTAPYAAFVASADLSALPDPAPAGSQPAVLDDAAFLGIQYICDQ
jgi:hypothetical protein